MTAIVGEVQDGWECVASNPETGVSTWMVFDDDGDIILQTRQEVSGLLDENRALANMASDNWAGEGMYSVARIPTEMAYDPNHILGGAMLANDDRVVRRVLNDSDYSKLRTKGGRL